MKQFIMKKGKDNEKQKRTDKKYLLLQFRADWRGRDETGVKSSIFGAFQKKSLSWEEIVYIKRLNLSIAPWVFISDMDLTNLRRTSAVMKRTITVMNQKGLKEAFEKYCPNFKKFGCEL